MGVGWESRTCRRRIELLQTPAASIESNVHPNKNAPTPPTRETSSDSIALLNEP